MKQLSTRENSAGMELKFLQPLPMEQDEGAEAVRSASQPGMELKYFNVRSIPKLQGEF